MKQFIALFALLLVVGMSIPVALAAEQETGTVTAQANTEESPTTGTVDPQTAHEVEAMDNTQGRVMRLTQLKEQLTTRVAQGNLVISELQAKNASANVTTDLQADVAQLQVLITETDSAIANASNETNQQSVQEFLTIKRGAESVIADFRAKTLNIAKDDVETLRNKIKEVRAQNEQQLQDQIKQLRENFNAQRVQAALAAMGATDQDLVNKVQAGTITAKDARDALKAQLDALKADKKAAAGTALVEQIAKRRVARAEAVANQLETNIDRQRGRLEQALNNTDNNKTRERLQNQLDKLDNRNGRIGDWQNNTTQRIEDWRTRMENRTDNRTNETRSYWSNRPMMRGGDSGGNAPSGNSGNDNSGSGNTGSDGGQQR